ncbi:hypothetical protein B0H17DRAFT_1099579 [Mycena rosella]|uniref:Uncharacterized protein n=1 Tax=Mycena rosella TaxID=1033263 RepID=A0AAD7CNF2_MYCRO|nr:hypothetical protein B0H17DRAFT_1099579 [Mycena rosella]
MTAASDYDILRYHTEAECRALYGEKYRPRVSGTEKNEIRRREAGAAAAAATSSAAAPRTAFISGPLAPSSTYFAEHYAPRLDAAIAQGDSFVVGPSAGIDTLAREYLQQRGVAPAHVAVYLSQAEGKLPRWRAFADGLRAQGVAVVVAGKGHTERDAAMTAASDYDILRYQTEAECRALYGKKYRPRVSGTELNEMRRKQVALSKVVPGMRNS